MFCRNATLQRNSWGAVLRGDVIIDGLDGQEIVGAIRKNCRLIVKIGKRHARRRGGLYAAHLLPVGYARPLYSKETTGSVGCRVLDSPTTWYVQ